MNFSKQKNYKTGLESKQQGHYILLQHDYVFAHYSYTIWSLTHSLSNSIIRLISLFPDDLVLLKLLYSWV